MQTALSASARVPPPLHPSPELDKAASRCGLQRGGAAARHHRAATAPTARAAVPRAALAVLLTGKRGLYGTFHSVSKKHLHRYVDEFTFRYNTREMDDGERTLDEIRNGEGAKTHLRTGEKLTLLLLIWRRFFQYPAIRFNPVLPPSQIASADTQLSLRDALN